ncbi:MAG: hypothetical protein RMI94_02575, partial [Bryobacterales bacterium]|nr:hypothetical protein [Bryobacterales bacterium]
MIPSWVMKARGPRGRGWTRRSWLLVLAQIPAPAARNRKVWPPEREAYPDPATEFLVERLTSPNHTSLLPGPYARAFSRKGDFLLYASDRAGSLQLYRMREPTGESEQLTEAAALEAGAFTLLADDDQACYFDGDVLYRLSLRNLKTRALYRTPQG